MDPRARRTRQLLQNALRVLLMKQRFSTISVQDITTQATVNRATFYAHYPDKEALITDIFKGDLRHAMVLRFSAPPPLTPETLTEMALVVFEFIGSHYDDCPETAAEVQDLVGVTIHESLYEFMVVWLPKNPIYKRLFPGCSKETVATVLASSIYSGASRWSRTPQRPPAIQVCREIVSMLLPFSLPVGALPSPKVGGASG